MPISKRQGYEKKSKIGKALQQGHLSEQVIGQRFGSSGRDEEVTSNSAYGKQEFKFNKANEGKFLKIWFNGFRGTIQIRGELW